MNNKFKKIKNIIKKIFKNKNSKLTIRNRKLLTTDLLYLFLYYSVSDISFNYLGIIANRKLKINISKSSLVKQFSNIKIPILKNIIFKIQTKLFNFNNNYNYIAVDGSYLNVNKNFKFDYPLSRDKQYKKILLSGLYDIKKQIPIYYSLNKTNERNALLNDILHLPQSKLNIIIGDRGYFSFIVIDTLLKHKIYFIFRIKSNLNFVKSNIDKLNKYKYVIIKYKNTELKLFLYIINKKKYYIISSKKRYQFNIVFF